MKTPGWYTRARHVLLNGALALASVLAAALLAEGALRLFYPQPVDYFYFPREPKPHTSFRRWGVPISLNALGFRDSDHAIEKPPGVTRIAVLGDSITFGTGVAFESVYHQQADRILSERAPGRYEVLAFNQGASSTAWALRVFREKAISFHPNIVLLGFCLNDFVENLAAEKSTPSAPFTRRVYDALAAAHERLRVFSHLYFLVFERMRRFLYVHALDRRVRTADSWAAVRPSSSEYRDIFNRGLTRTVQLIEELDREVSAHGASLLVVVFPFEMQLSPAHTRVYAAEYSIENLEDATRAEAQAALGAELARRRIEMLDLLPVFRAQSAGAPLFFRELGGMLDWAHPNARGHRIAAEAIAAEILNKQQAR